MTEPLHESLEFAGFVDQERDGAFLLKDGSIGLVIGIEGRDPECLDDEEILEIGNRFEGALRSVDQRFRLYQYQIKGDAGDGLFSIRTFMVLVLQSNARPSGFALGRSLTTGITSELEKSAGELRISVDRFIAHLMGTIPARILNAPETFRFFAELVNYDSRRAQSARFSGPEELGWQVTMSDLETFRGALLLGDTWCKVLTLKASQPERALPEETVPDFLNAIRLAPVNSIIVTEYRPLDPVEARKRLEGMAEHHHRQKYKTSMVTAIANMIGGFLSKKSDVQAEPRKDVVAEKSGVEASEAIANAAFDGIGLGEFALTVIVRSADRNGLDTAVSTVQAAAGKVNVGLFEEQMKAQMAWFAALPGGHRRQGRRMTITEHCYADMSLLYAPACGNRWNDHLNAPCLTMLETRQRTRFHLNLHDGEVGHTLMLGATGAGKTYTCKHLLKQAKRKYDPITIIFDMKDSYRDLTRAHGGTFMRVGERGNFRINPFCLAPTQKNLEFLNALVSLVIEHGDFRMTTDESAELWREIEAACRLFPPGDERRRLGKLLLPPRLRPQLEPWIGSGQYGWLFDNAEDNLSFARWQTFTFDGLDQKILEPLLFYILHRVNHRVVSPENEGVFKLCLLDEAWLFFANPTIRSYVKSALKTWRSANGAVVLATQSGADIQRSEIFETIVESTVTRLLLANPGADREWYRNKLGLNSAQVEHVISMAKRKELLILQGGIAKVVQLNERPEPAQSKEKAA